MLKDITSGLKIIINADDFGYCSQRDKGILELIDQGCISSISVMVNSPDIVEAAQSLNKLLFKKYEAFQDYLSIGLHFNITQFFQVSTKTEQKSLLSDENGRFKGKPYFYENIHELFSHPTTKDFIQAQIKAQIQKFIDIFKFRPSHIDGHNHVHVVPFIAQILSKTMTMYGIYHTRMPIPFSLPIEMQTTSLRKMNQIFISNAKQSRKMFIEKGIIFPDYLIGLQNMGDKLTKQGLSDQLQKIHQWSLDKNVDTYLQIMCHPGYLQKQYTCSFSGSSERQHELKILSEQSFQNFIRSYSVNKKLWTYNAIKTQIANLSVLVYSKLIEGSGNFTTSIRLQNILKNSGFYKVYYLNVPNSEHASKEQMKIQNMVQQFNIKLIIGINLTRTAFEIHQALTTINSNHFNFKIPYMLVIAGTDANITISAKNQKIDEKLKLINPIKQCLALISLSHGMKQKFTEFLTQHKITKQIEVISQSNCPLNFSPSSILNKTKPYFVFPTSFRSVKAVSHIFEELNQIIEQKQMDVYIFGPIINQKYFQEAMKTIGKIKYMGVYKIQEYLKYLENAFALINCSESEGMSCSILEAINYGIPVIARKNQGNMSLIEHNYNGFIYESKEDFMNIFQKLYQNYSELREIFRKNNQHKINDTFSFEREKAAYKCLLDNKFYSLTYTIQNPFNISSNYSFLSLPNVHGISQVNLQLMQKIFIGEAAQKQAEVDGWSYLLNLLKKKQQCEEQIDILDLGCGCGIFSIYVIYKLAVKLEQCKFQKQLSKLRINLHFSDVDQQALSNLLTNINQFMMLIDSSPFNKFIKISKYRIYHSSMFDDFPKQLKFDLILANLPQSPFQKEQSRVDKNAGHDSLKWHSIFLQQHANFLKNHDFSFSLLLYSHMAQPSKYKEICSQTKNQILWKSSPLTHKIHRHNYDEMQQGLSDYIQNFYKQGKADIKIENDIFYVPADLRIIRPIVTKDKSQK